MPHPLRVASLNIHKGLSQFNRRTVIHELREGLRTLDAVAYVRFASVYRDFREARDFNALIDELESGGDDDAPSSHDDLD